VILDVAAMNTKTAPAIICRARTGFREPYHDYYFRFQDTLLTLLWKTLPNPDQSLLEKAFNAVLRGKD